MTNEISKSDIDKHCLMIVEPSQKQYKEDRTKAANLILDGLTALVEYNHHFLRPQGLQIPFDIEELLNAAEIIFNREAKAAEESHIIGEISHCLWLFGCSDNQIHETLADWFNCGTTKIKTARKIYKSYWHVTSSVLNEAIKADDIIFLASAYSSVSEIIDVYENRSNRTFPIRNGHIKAKKALEKIETFYEHHHELQDCMNFPEGRYKQYLQTLESLVPDIRKRGHFLKG
jgi:hypothetical protein